MKALIVLSGLLLATTLARGEVTIRREPIQFKQGESAATIKGSFKGDEVIDYQLRAKAGQVMAVIFKPTNLSAYFNVMAPRADEAMFIGSTSGHRFEANLPVDGVYTIRVYLMRSAARRGESVAYTLDVKAD